MWIKIQISILLVITRCLLKTNAGFRHYRVIEKITYDDDRSLSLLIHQFTELNSRKVVVLELFVWSDSVRSPGSRLLGWLYSIFFVATTSTTSTTSTTISPLTSNCWKLWARFFQYIWRRLLDWTQNPLWSNQKNMITRTNKFRYIIDNF